MTYTYVEISSAKETLREDFEKLQDKKQILKHDAIKQLFNKIKDKDIAERKTFGAEVNNLKNEVLQWVNEFGEQADQLPPIDVTAPFDVNIAANNLPKPLDPRYGTLHPITQEIGIISNIFERMGFEVIGSRELDDDYHMFTSLNFPEGHPARDDWDTFITAEGYIAPAHTSTMQNRLISERKQQLESGQPIMVAVPDRCFRNEDLDVTHEHTFYQHEGVMIGKDITVGNLLATLKSFMSSYFKEDLKAKIQPFYFPFTEPSFEFVLQRPKNLRKSESEADMWLELLGCGMIHPNVLTMAGIDATKYNGFAWGGGIDRLIMMKYGIEDVRHFESGKLDFLRQFK